MALFHVALSVLAFLLFWFLTSTMFATSFPLPAELQNKYIVLLIGHPDDEAMFFGPSVLALTSSESGNRVQIICLSNGNAVGLGKTREKELHNSARRLGIRREDVYVKDDLRFQDGAQNDWRREDIAKYLSEVFGEHATSAPASSTSLSSPGQRPEPRQQQHTPGKPSHIPDAIITFDPQGISTHPNHCACYHGATHFVRQRPTASPIALYTLTSIPLLRKYISVLDAPITYLRSRPTNNQAGIQRADNVVLVSGFRDYARAFGAMVFAHKTQMLWFRWGWIISGRYMVINDLKRE